MPEKLKKDEISAAEKGRQIQQEMYLVTLNSGCPLGLQYNGHIIYVTQKVFDYNAGKKSKKKCIKYVYMQY